MPDYLALAKQFGGTTAPQQPQPTPAATTTPDYLALAKQFGGTTTPQSTQDGTGLGGWTNRVLSNPEGPSTDEGAWSIARGGVKSAGRGVASLIDAVMAHGPSDSFKVGYTYQHPGAGEDEINKAWQQTMAGHIAQHAKDTSDWLKAGSEPEGFWERVGSLGEQALEWFGGPELMKIAGPIAKAGEAAEAASAATRTAEQLKNTHQVATVLKANPKLAGLMAIGMRDAAAQAAQTYAHTEDPTQTAVAGGIGLAAPLVMRPIAAGAEKVLDRFGPKTVQIGKQAVPVLDQQLTKAGEILPEGTVGAPDVARDQQAGFEAHLGDAAKDAAAASLRRVHEAIGPEARPLLAAAEGAEPFQFTLYGPPTTETPTGEIAQSAAKVPRHAFEQPQYTTSSAPTRKPLQPPSEIEGPQPREAYAKMPTAAEGQMGTDIRTAGTPEARGETVGGGGALKSANPAEAVQWRNEYQRVIESPEFRDLPPEQQAHIQANYQQLSDELGMYYAKPHGGIVPPNIPDIQSRIETPGDAAEQIRNHVQEGYAELKRVAGKPFDQFKQDAADARAVLRNANSDEVAKAAARKARDAADAGMEDLIHKHAGDTNITRQYYNAMRASYADSVFLDNLNDEFEGMVNGVTRENTKGGKLIRVITGNTKGLEEFLGRDQNRANLARLMGPQAEENLKAFTELLANPGITRKTNNLVNQAAVEMAKYGGTASGLIWGPMALAGHGMTGAALAGTLGMGAWATRRMLRVAAMNPEVGRLVEYAIKNNVDTKVAAPLIARAASQVMQANQPAKTGEQQGTEEQK